MSITSPITKQQINNYNSQPEVKEKGVKLVKTGTDRFKTFLLIILIGFLICAAVFAYLAYNDKLKLLNISIPQCPAQPACPEQKQCPTCPTCPSCPTCSNNCNPTLRCNNSS